MQGFGVGIQIILDGPGCDRDRKGIGVAVQDNPGKIIRAVRFRQLFKNPATQGMIDGQEAGDLGQDLLADKNAYLIRIFQTTIAVDELNELLKGNLISFGRGRNRAEPSGDRQGAPGLIELGGDLLTKDFHDPDIGIILAVILAIGRHGSPFCFGRLIAFIHVKGTAKKDGFIFHRYGRIQGVKDRRVQGPRYKV